MGKVEGGWAASTGSGSCQREGLFRDDFSVFGLVANERILQFTGSFRQSTVIICQVVFSNLLTFSAQIRGHGHINLEQ